MALSTARSGFWAQSGAPLLDGLLSDEFFLLAVPAVDSDVSRQFPSESKPTDYRIGGSGALPDWQGVRDGLLRLGVTQGFVDSLREDFDGAATQVHVPQD